MDVKPRTLQAVEAAQERRKTQRKDFQSEAKNAHGLFAARSGALSMGMDENGVAVDTRSIRAFRIFVDKWYVRLGFKREDGSKLKDSGWNDVEAALKGGTVPTRLVRIDTHIVPAVRALKHVREGYENEVRQTDALLGILDTLNHNLVEGKSKHADAELEEAIKLLKAAQEEVGKKQSLVKKVVARGRVEKAATMLEKAKGMEQGGKRDIQVGAACAVIVSARNRLSTWRDKEIAGKIEYNLQKECSLRVERDRWLYSQLSRFASDPGMVCTYMEADRTKVEVLVTIMKMLKEKAPKDDILTYMVGKNQVFRISQKQRLKAEERKALMETGEVKGKKNVDLLMSHYELLYLAIKDGKLPQAKKEMRHLELFVCSNKPDFILDELSRSPDAYLAPVMTAMTAGVEALTFRHLDAAAVSFGKARDSLRAIIYPRPQK